MRLKPDFAKGYSRLGKALFDLGKYSEARDAYRQGLTVSPGNADMQSALSDCEMRCAPPAASSGAAPRAPARAGGSLYAFLFGTPKARGDAMQFGLRSAMIVYSCLYLLSFSAAAFSHFAAFMGLAALNYAL